MIQRRKGDRHLYRSKTIKQKGTGIFSAVGLTEKMPVPFSMLAETDLSCHSDVDANGKITVYFNWNANLGYGDAPLFSVTTAARSRALVIALKAKNVRDFLLVSVNGNTSQVICEAYWSIALDGVFTASPDLSTEDSHFSRQDNDFMPKAGLTVYGMSPPNSPDDFMIPLGNRVHNSNEYVYTPGH